MDQAAMQQVPVCDLVRVRIYTTLLPEGSEVMYERIVPKNELLQHIQSLQKSFYSPQLDPYYERRGVTMKYRITVSVLGEIESRDDGLSILKWIGEAAVWVVPSANADPLEITLPGRLCV